MSRKVGVISDTHGILRPEVLDILRTCDHIVHAGDFDNGSVLEELEDIAPVTAVRGNNDWSSWASRRSASTSSRGDMRKGKGRSSYRVQNLQR